MKHPPAWPARRVRGSMAAALDLGWHEIICAANKLPDPLGLVTAYAAARAVEFFDAGVVLALNRVQLAMGLDQPHNVQALSDFLSATFGRPIAVVTEPDGRPRGPRDP